VGRPSLPSLFPFPFPLFRLSFFFLIYLLFSLPSPVLPPLLSFPFPLFFLISLPFSPLPLLFPSIQLGSLGALGSEAKPQPKFNLVYFGCQIWHLVTTFVIFARKSCPNVERMTWVGQYYTSFMGGSTAGTWVL